MQSQRQTAPRSRQQSVLPSFAPPSTATAQAACSLAPSQPVGHHQEQPGMHTPQSQCKRPNTSFPSELGVLQQRGGDTGTHLGSHRQQRQGGEGGGERLSQLHARLQQEAEKIRQWKTATEMDLRQKDAKLQEALHTVETQRRDLVELQLSNSTLESKLRDEVINQEDIRRRIDTTREMCTLLKNEMARTEDVLAEGETDKETFQQLNKTRVDEYQELVIKFQEMELEQTVVQETLRDKLACEEAAEKLLSDLQLELAAAGKRVEALEDERGKAVDREAGLKEDLKRMTKEYQALEEQKLTLEHIARNKDESLVEQLSTLNSVQSKFKQKQEEALDLQVQLERAQQHVLSLEQECHSTLTSARAAQEVHQQELESLQVERSEVYKQLQAVDAELRRTTVERDQLQDELKRLTEDAGSLKAQKQACIETINQLSAEKEELARQCNKLAVEQEEANVKRVDAERQTKEMEDKIHRTQAALEEAQTSLQSITEGQGAVEAELVVVRKALLEKETDVDLIKEQLCEALHQRTESCSKLRTLAEIFTGTRIPSPENADIELMVLADYVSESVEGLQHRVEVYQSQCSDLVNQLDKMAKENTDLRSAAQKLKDQLKHKRELSNAELEKQKASVGELQEKLLQKTEELACLQGRLDGIEVARSHGEEEVEEARRERDTLEEKTAHLEGEKAQLQREATGLQMELSNALEAKQTLEEQIALLGEKDKSSVADYHTLSTLNGELTAELTEKAALVEKLTGKVEECRAEVEKVVQERERSKVEHEQQIADLASTLQMYQVENQKIVDQKDREIASVQEKLETAQGMESKVEGLQAELAQTISERDLAHVQLQEERSRAEELEKQVTTAPSFKVPSLPSTPKTPLSESPHPPASSTTYKTPLRNTSTVSGCGHEQVLSTVRTRRVAAATVCNSNSQRAPTERGVVNQQEDSDGSEEEEECVMEVNRSWRPSHCACKPTSPSTPIPVSPYLRDATNHPPTAPFTPCSYSTPKSSSFLLSYLKTPTVPQRASSTNFRVAPSPSRRAPTRGGARPQSTPHQSPRITRSKEDSFKKPNAAPKPNSRKVADTSLRKQPQAWTKKAPANTHKPSRETATGAGRSKKGHAVPAMGMSWFDQDDIFGFGTEQ